MADVFISYKKADRSRVEGLVRDLEAEGFTVWWDYEIGSGENWLERILKEVDVARCVVGVWTRAAINPSGTFIASEESGINYVRIEHERGARKLAPALLEDTALPVQFADLQTSDLKTWTAGQRDHPGFRALVSQIEALATPGWALAKIAGLEARLMHEESRRKIAEKRAAESEVVIRDEAERTAREAESLARQKAEFESRLSRFDAVQRERDSFAREAEALSARLRAAEEQQAAGQAGAQEIQRLRRDLDAARAAAKAAPARRFNPAPVIGAAVAGLIGIVIAYNVGHGIGYDTGSIYSSPASAPAATDPVESVDAGAMADFLGDWVLVSGSGCYNSYQRLSRSGGQIEWQYSSDGSSWTRDSRTDSGSRISGSSLYFGSEESFRREGSDLIGVSCAASERFRRASEKDLAAGPFLATWTQKTGGCFNQRLSLDGSGRILWEYQTDAGWQTDERGGSFSVSGSTLTVSDGTAFTRSGEELEWGGCTFTR